MGFIKAWFGIGDDDEDIEPVKPREYPEKLVDNDISYRDKYEEQLRNEILFLKQLIFEQKAIAAVPGLAERLSRPMDPRTVDEVSENLSVSPSFQTFGSVRAQVERKLRENAASKEKK